MIKRLLILCCFIPLYSYTQVRVSTGTQLQVEAGTVMTLHSPTDSLITETASALINHGTIVLHAGTQVSEASGYPITGNGYETITKNIISGSAEQNVNGTGLWFKNDGITGSFTIQRWHMQSTNQAGDVSVKRLFKLSPAAMANYQAGVQYDISEKNSLDSLHLMLFTSTDSLTWTNQGGTANGYAVKYTDTLQGTQFITGYEAQILPPVVSDSVFCTGDSVFVGLATEGLFNANSAFILEIDNDPGFASAVTVDTVYETGGTLGFVPTGILPGGDTLFLRIRGLHPHIDTLYLDNIVVYTYPVVSITGLDNHYCSNGMVDPIVLSPVGGMLTGPGSTGTGFDPQAAGLGSFVLTYSYTNTAGCSASMTDTTTVTAAPVALLSAPQTSFCENDSAVVLVGSPSGGVFGGTGISDSVFSPTNAGPGNFVMTYQVTDAAGCGDTDSLPFIVNALPTMPVISANYDTLWANVTSDHYQWYQDGNPVTGSDSPFLVVNADGNYNVEVTNAEGCTVLSAAYIYIGTWLNVLNNGPVHVYPNPVSMGQTLQVNTSYTNLFYNICTAEGKVVEQGNAPDGHISTRIAAQGVYFLQLTAGNVLFRHKILVIEK